MAATKGTTRPRGLAKGTEVRSARAALKQAMKAGKVDPLKVVAGAAADRWETVARDMPLETLLLAVPGIGAATVDALLDERGIRPSTRVYGLTDERRREIAKAVEEVVGRGS